MSGVFSTSQKLNSMRYKSFTWEYNPATCTYSCQKAYAKHKYPEVAGVELEDMHVNEIVITGKGEFFGENAYSNWLKLNAEFKLFGPGTFYHPIFTDVTRALMTRLQADMEPRENYVAYSFEFISDTEMLDINQPVEVITANNTLSSQVQTDNTIKVGDMVFLTGYAYYNSSGGYPRSSYKNNVKYTVTQTNYGSTHPIHCGSLGWCTLQSVKLAAVGTANTTQNNTSDIIHTVKTNDTLFSIGKMYGVDWQTIASYNSIRDPNKIIVGQKIRIPASMVNKQTNNSVGNKNITGSRNSISVGGGTNVSHVIN